jgi:aspartyl-tRNA(Asn)/glutamyl-tRNA(Gln) amidotransferase subunit B
MEEGSLRCDANVSIRPVGAEELGTKAELKNMNSFRFLAQGIDAEVARQTALLERGEHVEQETLHFDPQSGTLRSMRSKEEAHDYRYFPEPDLVPVTITPDMLAAARGAMPELPAARAERYERELLLRVDSARLLAFRAELAEFFEQALAAANGSSAQEIANWTEQLAARLAGDQSPSDSRVTPAALAALAALAGEGTVTTGAARDVLDRLLADGGDPRSIVEQEGLAAIGGSDELAPIVAAAIAANGAAAEKLRAGNEKAIGPIIGLVMRETKGRADGGEVTRLVREQLGI